MTAMLSVRRITPAVKTSFGIGSKSLFSYDHSFSQLVPGPAAGEGQGGLQPPPTFFGNFEELLRKRCFQIPHFESLISPPTFKVAPQACVHNFTEEKMFSVIKDICYQSWINPVPVQAHVHIKFEVCDPQIAGNALKLSILPSSYVIFFII